MPAFDGTYGTVEYASECKQNVLCGQRPAIVKFHIMTKMKHICSRVGDFPACCQVGFDLRPLVLLNERDEQELG